MSPTFPVMKFHIPALFIFICLCNSNVQGGKLFFSNALTESGGPRPFILSFDPFYSLTSDFYAGLNIKSPVDDNWNLVCFTSSVGSGFFHAGLVEIEGYPEDLPLQAYVSV